jgi:hypothetical protein
MSANCPGTFPAVVIPDQQKPIQFKFSHLAGHHASSIIATAEPVSIRNIQSLSHKDIRDEGLSLAVL